MHFHILALDGVYLDRSDRKLSPEFIDIKSPTDSEIQQVVKKVVQKIALKSVKALRKLGFLEDATEEVLATGLDSLCVDEPEHALTIVSAQPARELHPVDPFLISD